MNTEAQVSEAERQSDDSSDDAQDDLLAKMRAPPQALVSDSHTPGEQFGLRLAQKSVEMARNLKTALEGGSIGEAFLADARGTNALSNLQRYETTLINTLRKAILMLPTKD